MKYFIDTEFLEGTQDKTIFGIKYGQTKPTIDLISIALVSEDERKYYAISKDFNLKEAWNRYQIEHRTNLGGIGDTPTNEKVYWIRENVLKSIWKELYEKEHNSSLEGLEEIDLEGVPEWSYKYLKYLINKYGKTNKQIAKEIKEFICPVDSRFDDHAGWYSFEYTLEKNKPQFYGYFADYDWVAFCWLFGKMIDLPKGFPMYCVDLKQELDEKIEALKPEDFFKYYHMSAITYDQKMDVIKNRNDYPKLTDEHNALADARWNCELYKFIESL